MLVPVLYLPSAQPVHVVSSEDLWLSMPAVKYFASGHVDSLSGHEVAAEVPVLYLPPAQSVHVVSSDDLWLSVPAVKYFASGHVDSLSVHEVAAEVPVLYLPPAQPVQEYPLVAPEQVPTRCWPTGQVASLQFMHTVSVNPEHLLPTYCPDAQAAQLEHRASSVPPPQPPLRNLPLSQVEHVLHAWFLVRPEHPVIPEAYSPVWQDVPQELQDSPLYVAGAPNAEPHVPAW